MWSGVFGDLGVVLPAWAVAALVALPVLDVLHSFSPWSHALWVEHDHGAWTRFWGVVTGIRWLQTAVAVVVLANADVSFAAVGLRLPGTPVLAVSILLVVGAIAWYAYAAVRAPTVPREDAPTGYTTNYPADVGERTLWFVAGGVTAGFCEEFLYRGAVFVALLGLGVGWPIAALIAALAFAGAHGFAALNPVALAFYVGFALVATGIVAVTSSLLPAMAVHAAWNLTGTGRTLRETTPERVTASA